MKSLQRFFRRGWTADGPDVFSVRSAVACLSQDGRQVLGRSNVRPPTVQELLGISPAPKPAAPEDGRTPLNRYEFRVRSAVVLGRSNVRPPTVQELLGISPAPKPAAPEDGRTPPNRHGEH